MNKSVKTVLLSLFLVCGLLLGISAARPAQAATKVKMTRSNFDIYSGGANGVKIGVRFPYTNIEGDLRIYLNGKKVQKKIVPAASGITYATFNFTPKKNRIYYYRIRPMYNGQYVGKWTKYRAFTSIDLGASLPDRTRNIIRLTLPKMSGVKYVDLYMSTSNSNAGTKIGRLTPGKSIDVSKYNGSALVRNQNYYFTSKVKLTDGTPCFNIFLKQTYIYTAAAKGTDQAEHLMLMSDIA